MSEPVRWQVRCERCLGRGYQGRNRRTSRGFQWKLETCRGTGQRPATDRQRVRRKAS